MPEYQVELVAHVYAEWTGEASDEKEAEQLALQCPDLAYEVDFDVAGVWGPDDE